MYHLERKRIFTLTADYFTFASLTAVPRLEATVFMNREQIQRLILSMKLELPTLGPHTYLHHPEKTFQHIVSTKYLLDVANDDHLQNSPAFLR